MSQFNFRVYKSSAGSGKTTTLVQEYLKIALIDPSKYRQIVGITFTIKATNEMKSRVIDTLIDLSRGVIDVKMRKVAEELMTKYDFTEALIKSNSEELLANILHGYSFFAFSTIDSFVVRLVRSFAFDLKLPLNFGIELQKNIIIEEAVAALVSDAGYEKKLTQFLINYINNQSNDGKTIRIQSLIAELSDVLFNDSYTDFTESLKIVTSDDLYSFADELVKKTAIKKENISLLGKTSLKLIEGKNLTSAIFFQGERGIFSYFKNLSFADPKKLGLNSYANTTLNDDKWCSGKCSAADLDGLNSIKDQLISIVRTVESLKEDYISHFLLRKNVESLALLKEVQNKIQGYYSENNVVHLSETLNRVAAVVDHEQIPFIYERLGTLYSHYLIDEFQDTSTRQWHNLLPLLDDALSSGNFNLVVGDAKQSIYRWRGGDFEQFVNLPAVPNADHNSILSLREEALKRNYSEIILDVNYRSLKAVLNFNNAFYKYCIGLFPDNEIVQSVFNKFEQKKFNELEGYVELRLLPKNSDDFVDLNNSVIEIIRDLMLRNVPLKDIVVLARNNKNLTVIAEVLLDNDIPFISSNSLQLIRSNHINFLINILRWISQPADRLSALAIYQYLLQEKLMKKEIDDSELIGINLLNFNELFQLLDLPPTLLDFDDPAQVVEFFAFHLNIYKKDYAFVLHLLGFIHQSQLSVGIGVSTFLNYFDKYAELEYVAMPENIDAINLLSIHKSKGLEYRVVILVDFEIKRKGNQTDYLTVNPQLLGFTKPSFALINNDLLVENSVFAKSRERAEKLKIADKLNIGYVATTRAKNEFYFIAEEKSEYHQYLKGFTETDFPFMVNESGNNFTIGTTEIFKEKSSNHKNVILEYDYFQPWQEKIGLNHKVINELKFEEVLSSKSIGNIIHELLSSINSINDIDAVLQKALNLNLIARDEVINYRNLIESVLQKTEIQIFFNPKNKVLNERTILTKTGTEYRPDRVVILEDEISIVDYKYSEFQEVEEFQHQKYRQQVAQYIDVLSDIYPNKRKSGFLLWLKGEIILEKI